MFWYQFHRVGFFFTYHQGILGPQLNVLQFNLILTVSAWLRSYLDRRDAQGKLCGKESRTSFLSEQASLPQISTCLPTQKLLEPSPFKFLWKLHYIRTTDYILGHWWLNSLSSSAPHPGGPEVGLKVSHFNHRVRSLGNQEPSLGDLGLSKVTSLTQQKIPLSLSLFRKSQEFQELCARSQDQILYFLVSHTILHLGRLSFRKGKKNESSPSHHSENLEI